jgi:hypothetical protein
MASMVLLSTGIVAVLHFLAASTAANASTGNLAVAAVLADNAYEYALSLDPGLPPPGQTAVTHVLQLSGQTFTPPRDGQGEAIDNLREWSQRFTVVAVERGALQGSPVTATPKNLRRVTVSILRQGKQVGSASWILAPSIPQS